MAYRASSSNDHVACALCGTNVPVNTTIYTADGHLVCRACGTRRTTSAQQRTAEPHSIGALLGFGLLALLVLVLVAGAILYASLLAHPLRLPIGS